MEKANSQGENLKVYVKNNGVAIITCPACEARKTVKVDTFKGAKHILKVKCQCQKIFSVDLEFRKLYRKPAKLQGNYALLPDRKFQRHMTVVNISMGGVGLLISGDHRLQIGQQIQVTFKLDDKQYSLIDRPAIVRLINNNYVSCELSDNNSLDKALGFYMMP